MNKPATAGGPELDFWVGGWTCSGESFDATGKSRHSDAKNSIVRSFGGHVLQETFTLAGFK